MGAFLDYVRTRPEDAVVVVAHEGCLAALCRAALDPGEDPELYAYLEPAEALGLVVEWKGE